jgi:hypothetical protein
MSDDDVDEDRDESEELDEMVRSEIAKGQAAGAPTLAPDPSPPPAAAAPAAVRPVGRRLLWRDGKVATVDVYSDGRMRLLEAWRRPRPAEMERLDREGEFLRGGPEEAKPDEKPGWGRILLGVLAGGVVTAGAAYYFFWPEDESGNDADEEQE